jgi:Kef-type K+ transport system membrane component KefB
MTRKWIEHAKRRTIEIAALAVCLGLSMIVTKVEPYGHVAWNVLLAIGYLLFAGTILGNLVEPLRLPHLTAYIAVGVIGGPYVLHLLDHETVAKLVPVNTLAISLIALAGGLELHANVLWSLAKSLIWSNFFQSVVVFVATAGVFFAFAQFIPFAATLPGLPLLGVSMIWGVLATSRSPSATLAILDQTKAKGPLSRWSLAFVMSSDVVVVTLSALVLVAVRPWLVDEAELNFQHVKALARELVGSISLGICLGLILIAYLRLVNKHLVLILLVLGFVLTDGLKYVHFDPLLAFLVTGFVVRNLSVQGEKLLSAVSRVSGVVFVVFFATAGAHLDLNQLVSLWPFALLFFFVRFIGTVVANSIATKYASDESTIRKFGFAPLLSQAGLTLALAQTVEREFPQLAGGFQSLVIATVAVNEVVGPIVFKYVLERLGEAGAGRKPHFPQEPPTTEPEGEVSG